MANFLDAPWAKTKKSGSSLIYCTFISTPYTPLKRRLCIDKKPAITGCGGDTFRLSRTAGHALPVTHCRPGGGPGGGGWE